MTNDLRFGVIGRARWMLFASSRQTDNRIITAKMLPTAVSHIATSLISVTSAAAEPVDERGEEDHRHREAERTPDQAVQDGDEAGEQEQRLERKAAGVERTLAARLSVQLMDVLSLGTGIGSSLKLSGSSGGTTLQRCPAAQCIMFYMASWHRVDISASPEFRPVRLRRLARRSAARPACQFRADVRIGPLALVLLTTPALSR
jgi:hypothetical protein